MGLFLALILLAVNAFGHGVAAGDAKFLAQFSGEKIVPFAYLGAKHMITGYDHLLFLAGVVFFLFRFRDVAIYASLFAIGHSVTLLIATLASIHVDAYLVDAIIGLSVAYKALENMGVFHAIGLKINQKAAVFLFGLIHGLGLSSKLQDFNLSQDGLVTNIVSFNVGVELGQLAALTVILIILNIWRKRVNFTQEAYSANLVILTLGFILFGYQLVGYFIT